MKLYPSDPDIQTLVTRIQEGVLQLQPDFQRGEVWGLAKKRRLLDTILRQWHVPPIHVVVDEAEETEEVLDGQQRLAAIRDFVAGEIKVDGSCEPADPDILALDGMTYNDLPLRFRRQFDRFTIRVMSITDYSPEEPGELFFRLNQPTNLTAAEQRNAFFGEARKQVKGLVGDFIKLGLTQEILGFSNSRMAYDDVVAKVAYTLHIGTLREKVTGGVVTQHYRTGNRFELAAIARLESALKLLGAAAEFISPQLKFNKATLFSWLLFLTQFDETELCPRAFGFFVSWFETERTVIRGQVISWDNDTQQRNLQLDPNIVRNLFMIFNDRASSRVADVASVLIRDFTIWLFACQLLETFEMPIAEDERQALAEFIESIRFETEGGVIERELERCIGKYNWGTSR